MIAAVSSETIGVAIVISIFGPGIVGYMTTRAARATAKATAETARQNKLEDWARADQLSAAADRAELAATTTNANLVEIAVLGKQTHALVNSDMTDEKKSQLAVAIALRVVLTKLIAQDQAAGREPATEDVEALHITKNRIAELTKIIADREAAQKAIDDKAAADLAAAITTGNGPPEAVA